MKVVFGISLIGLLLFGCGSQEERRAQHSERAETYFAAEQWNEAKIEFLNLLQIDPDDADANYRLAEVHLRLQEYQDALWRFQEAVRLKPDDEAWRLRLAAFLLLARRNDLVVQHTDAVLERNPASIEALLLQARVLMDRGDPAAALEVTEKIFEIDPARPEGLAIKSQLLTRLEDLDGAEESLRELVSHENSVASFLLLGNFLSAQRGKPKEGVAMYRRALEVAEDASQRQQIRLLIANYFISQSDNQSAEKELLEAKAEDPTNASLLVQLAQFYAFQRRTDEAERLLHENVENSPDSAGPLLTLAEFHQRLGAHDAALEAVDRALEIEPGSEVARLQRAQYRMERREEDPTAEAEARELLRSVLEDNPNSLNAIFTEAKFLLVDGEFDEAILRLRRVVEDQPSANAHFLLGTAYLQLAESELARSEFVQTLQLDANHQLARTQLAALYLRMGSRQLAAQEASRALERTSEDPRLLLILANAQAGLDQRDDALKALDKIDFARAPEPRSFRLEAANLYRSLRELTRSRQLLDEVLAENPADADALRSLMRTEVLAARPQVMLPKLDAAIELAPDDAALYEIRGGVRMGFQRDGKFVYEEEAASDLLRAIELDPERAEAHALLGRMRHVQGRLDESIQLYEKAVEKGPRNVAYYLALGAILQSLERNDQAIALYERLIEIDEDNPLGKNNLAWLLASRDQAPPDVLDRALELAQDAKEKLPESPAIADTLGFVMLKKDIPGAAISLFKEAIANYSEGSPGRAAARYHLGLAYERNGELERAMAEFESALAESSAFPDRAAAEQALERLRSS